GGRDFTRNCRIHAIIAVYGLMTCISTDLARNTSTRGKGTTRVGIMTTIETRREARVVVAPMRARIVAAPIIAIVAPIVGELIVPATI
ncbi:unnamed protein product, partial [Prunus brigantina]